MEKEVIPHPLELKNLSCPSENLELINMDRICRLCGKESTKLIGIHTREGTEYNLSTTINLYLPIKVRIDDDLPQQCCLNCTNTLSSWHDFFLASIESDRRFRVIPLVTETGSPDDQKTTTLTVLDPLPIFCQTESEDANSPKKNLKAKIVKYLKKPKAELSPDLLQTVDIDMNDIEQHFILEDNLEIQNYKLNDLDPIAESNSPDDSTEPKKLDSFYQCQFCAVNFATIDDITAHLSLIHPDKEFEPANLALFTIKNEADARGKNKAKIQSKKLDPEAISAAKVIVDGREYYNCKECGKSLHSPYTYMWHMRIHTGERPYVCDLCGKQFRVSQGLVRHLRETHEGIKKYPCDLCGRMFATRRNVEEHRRIHTNERPYVCDLCGKSFKQKASLFVHNRSHKNHFPFKCSYCNQGFRTKPPLMIHITRHTGEKPYKCETCGRCFRIKYELKRHRLVHSDEKPWVCSLCGLGFRQKRYLRNHIKANHPAAFRNMSD